nr:coiled coil domain containing protein [Hymenolepis microstoma]
MLIAKLPQYTWRASDNGISSLIAIFCIAHGHTLEKRGSYLLSRMQVTVGLKKSECCANFPFKKIYTFSDGDKAKLMVNAQYNQAAYRAKREMHLFQLAEWSRRKNPEFMDTIKYQMAGTIYQVLSNAKNVLDKNEANDPSRVPKNLEAGEAWALVVENSALLCELVVRFPETSNSVLLQPDYHQVVGWALDFLLETKYPNDNDKKLVQFAKYELHLAPPPESYRNPFSEENKRAVKDILVELEKKKKRSESKRQARKPKLSPRADL